MDKPYMPGSDPYYEEEPIDMPLSTEVCLSAKGTTGLEPRTQRRALVQRLIDMGGCATIADLEAEFGFDVTSLIDVLIVGGWIEVRS